MPATHVYKHPEGKGFGQHHAGGTDLAARPAQPPEAAAALRSAAAVMQPTPEQAEALEAFLARSMADLDMADGTEVEHTGDDAERGIKIVNWTDKHGDGRSTGITPEFFATYFQPVAPPAALPSAAEAEVSQ